MSFFQIKKIKDDIKLISLLILPPCVQRLALTKMRADHEERKRKRIESEVWQLRDKIAEMNLKIATITKGLPVSKVFVTKISQHQKRWKKLCNSITISKMFSVKNSQVRIALSYLCNKLLL